MISRLARAHDQPGGRVMNFRPFFGHDAVVRSGTPPTEADRDHFAYALAVAALEA